MSVKPLDTWSVEEAEGLANAAFDKMGIAEWRAMVNEIARALERERLRTLQPSTPSEREQFLAHIDQCDLVARIREAVEALRAPYLIQASDAYRYEAIEAALAAIDRVTSSQTEPTDPPET